ncbi:MAG: hypothetical protein KME32_16600 [Mojavia pulchra JT2-VF2]|jgi:hypothetical protein|uniref:Uncharacterized protein n=1 Tax=Mojavia pulchra JT2-VF2 TaxID=287848 RepID=A0A951Q0U7_9NOST|nr:hypothetical protein [Mojavia pulchra JT2-VF2]
MTQKIESYTEFEARLDKMIQAGKLEPKYKSLILEIAELGDKAYANGLILGLGWGEDAKNLSH